LRQSTQELILKYSAVESANFELISANKELVNQNNEKEKRAAELIVANIELAFQNEEKEKRAAELIVANKELAFQNEEKEKRAAELIVANKELAFQNKEKEKRAAELIVANKELAFQNKEKEKRAAELIVANIELAFQNEEKEKRAAELIVANKELAFQNDEKEKRAAELIVANSELAYQNEEKEKRASELIVANSELAFQNNEKSKRAAELIVANKELAFQNDEKEKRVTEINDLAFYDPLTRLPNRRLLVDRLQQALATSMRTGQEGALLYLDLDNFKTLNDTFGHNCGNLLLQQVAMRLSQSVRVGDTVSRVGGDEFVVILQALSVHNLQAAANARAIANKILIAINKPYQLDSTPYLCTSSIGVTLFNCPKSDMEELLQQADIAMYQAKKEGRNTLRFYDPQMQEAINARATLEEELRVAIEDRQFQLYYQVQVDASGQTVGAEALIRWIHPERGMISPINFIPLCEETGLILPLGDWVINTACAQLRDWQKQPSTRDLVLAVNVSARQFSQTNFVEKVRLALQSFDVSPTLLKLELTEGMLLNNIDQAIDTMNELCKIGVRFSLDDFGTGYSSLQYLKKLPLDQIKIDQSFVRDIVDGALDKSIVCTIIAMASAMGLNVIAEGVETEKQQEILLSEGCSNFQGYFFGKPVPIDKFEAALLLN
jgi:diguanylate cyclase (GGDEF)-like protein